MRQISANRAGTAGGRARIIGALRRGLLLMAACTLVGCSALRLGYGQGPELAYLWADRYLDFDGNQSPQVRAALHEWFAWHRSNELPEYARQLAAMQSELQQPVTAEQVCRFYEWGAGRLDEAWEHALPAMAQVAPTLRPEQLKHMARRFDKLNAEFEDEMLSEPPQEQRRLWAEQLGERYETLFGSLERAQRRLIEAEVARLPMGPAQWHAERLLRQQDTLATLRQIAQPGVTPAEAQARLQALFERSRQSPRPAYRALAQQQVKAHCALFAQVQALATPAQRRHAAEKLQGWQDDARALAGQGRPAAVKTG